MNKKTILYFLLISIVMLLTACAKEGGDDDPIIGLWKIKEIRTMEGSADVTKVPCYNESTLNVTKKTLRITFKVQDDNGSCQSDTDNYNWENQNGVYKIVDDEETDYIQITLNNGDLLMRLSVPDEQPMTFVYRK